MDDSPRSSKRRKVDTPKRIVSTPLKKSLGGSTPGRLATRSVSYANSAHTNGDKESSTPRRTGRTLKSTPKAIAAKREAPDEIDVYDDIEGALNSHSSPRPTRAKLPAASRESTSTIDELQDAISTPGQRKVRPVKTASISRSAARKPVRGRQNGISEDTDHQDDLSTGTLTPIKRTKATRTPVASVRKAAAPRSSGRTRREVTPEEAEGDIQDSMPVINGTTPTKVRSAKKTNGNARKQTASENEEAVAITPSRSSKRRKPIEEHTVIPDTEDELAHPQPTSARKQTASARRRISRTDHITNHEEEHWSDVEKSKDASDDDDIDVDGNSVLGSVLDPTEPSPFNKPPSTHKQIGALPVICSVLTAGRELDVLQTIVMERITGKRPSPLVGLDAEYKSVHQLVEHTVTAGEGNSMLVIGARGSGKTALINKVLSEVAKDNSGEFHIARLNGFIHTDDKIALREIWRQLGKERDIEEDGSGPGKNYADTLATLLALLSHPSENTGEVTDQVAKAVIFIIDEFDLFAQHPRQTLLYNLFDIAQSRKAPIAVLGLTTRIDVTNSLEKRVKSRFSHRYVHLSLAKTFTAFQEICKACLLVQPEHLTIEERGILGGGTKSTPAKGRKDAKQDVLAEWNTSISVSIAVIMQRCRPHANKHFQNLFSTSSFLTTHLAPTFYLTKSIPTVLTSFLLPTANLSSPKPFYPTATLNPPDSKLSLIPHLSTLALSLLIAAARLDIIHDSDTCNFNMAYDEYVTLASRARIQSAAGGLSSSSSTSKVWGKDVARRGWESLVDLGFVMPVVIGQAGGFGMVRCDVALEEIGEVLKGVKGGDKGVERWCRSL